MAFDIGEKNPLKLNETIIANCFIGGCKISKQMTDKRWANAVNYLNVLKSSVGYTDFLSMGCTGFLEEHNL